MKNTVIKFGLYGFLLAIVLFLSGLYFGKGMDFSTQEVVGYLTMVVSLLFIFFGIKHFRDNINSGEVTLTKGLLIGILISIFTASGIAIADFIYTSVINPDFFTDYVAMMREQGHTEEIPDWCSGFMAFIMFITVLIIGLIISLISALILQRKN
ncbi:DUF4199 domain-containing protein [Maribacter algarum]|uniref:DUF4199 domain-containing protein n=1 Tax=Maribacter algarum (ex Zhang et al. 2020) TaxID=2578118 RepID=A0A5S3PU01_9FLAO|nr:DUF4199 domain-containing protein [Maribacter algarum]TMM58465.1 DUF4199 domain-containing protein [Maribacter algarum]